MVTVIGIRFKTGSRIYYFDPIGIEFADGDGVIVETARGLEFGTACGGNMEVEESGIVQPLKPVIRKATEEDARMRDEYAAKEPDAFAVCEKKIAEHGLDMKLVDVEYTFNGSKVVFYFTADERVDFRELVKDLASHFRTRIELRQIGVRDEAKMLGGLGPCGRPVCCSAFLDDFKPVSIKMAKEQNLSLSPTKISGLCGRLMCCLQYEEAVYEETHKKMPRAGKEICCPAGQGIVVENNAVTERTKVRLILEDGTVDVKEYPYTSLWKPGEEPAVPPEEIEKPKEKPLPQSVAYVAPEISTDGEKEKKERGRSFARSRRERHPEGENSAEKREGETTRERDKSGRRRRGGRGRTFGEKAGEGTEKEHQQDGSREVSGATEGGKRENRQRPRKNREQAAGEQKNQSAEGTKPENKGGDRRRRYHHRGGRKHGNGGNGGTPAAE